MRTNHKIDSSRAISGFTLIELVIVIIAFGIIGTISIGILRSGGDVYFDLVNRQAVVGHNRISMWRMVREISLQRDKNHLGIASGTELQVVTPRLNSLKYDLTGNKVRLTKNQSVAHELADNVVSSQSSLAYWDDFGNNLDLFPLSPNDRQKVMLIDLQVKTAKGDDNLTLRSSIFPKNLHYGERISYHE